MQRVTRTQWKSLFGDYTTIIRQETIFQRIDGHEISTGEKIEIRTIEHGIRTVEAETIYGGMYGLGYVHAQDRLWFMNFYRHMSKGTLSSVFGSECIPIDKYIRTIGVPAQAEYHYERIDQDGYDSLVHYANGVNEAVRQMSMLPLEFQMTWTGFDEWQPIDSLRHYHMLVNLMSGDWYFEALRERLTEVYPRVLVD